MKRTLSGSLIIFACVALAISLPIILGDDTIVTAGVLVFAYTATAVAWNIFSGFTGYISLGHAVYFGVGGYTLALLMRAFQLPGGTVPLLLLPICGIVAALSAIPIGWIILRSRLYAFVVITIALLFIMQRLAANISFFGNEQGIYITVPDWTADFFDIPFYYVGLIVLLLAVLATWLVRRSKFGLDLLAIRDDEARARSLGVAVGRYKLLALILSAFFTGMVGALLMDYLGAVTPERGFTPALDVMLALIVFMGGAGTILGPILSGLFVTSLQQYVDLNYSQNAPGIELILFGVLLLLVVIFLPEGIVPGVKRLWAYWQTRRDRQATEQALKTVSSEMPPEEAEDEPLPEHQQAESSIEGVN